MATVAYSETTTAETAYIILGNALRPTSQWQGSGLSSPPKHIIQNIDTYFFFIKNRELSFLILKFLHFVLYACTCVCLLVQAQVYP